MLYYNRQSCVNSFCLEMFELIKNSLSDKLDSEEVATLTLVNINLPDCNRILHSKTFGSDLLSSIASLFRLIVP